jgi:hypothetical protein
MGYIGLLLNAPYKRDSMVWMRCRLDSFYSGHVFLIVFCTWLGEPVPDRGKKGVLYV